MALQSFAITEQLINKLVLKSEVTLPILTGISTQKIVQKIKTISPLSNQKPQPTLAKARQLVEKVPSQKSQSQQKWAFIQSKVKAGESAFIRKQYELAVNEYNCALRSLSQLKSGKYYRVLMKKGECLKRLRNREQLFKLYSELSLVSVGN